MPCLSSASSSGSMIPLPNLPASSDALMCPKAGLGHVTRLINSPCRFLGGLQCFQHHVCLSRGGPAVCTVVSMKCCKGVCAVAQVVAKLHQRRSLQRHPLHLCWCSGPPLWPHPMELWPQEVCSHIQHAKPVPSELFLLCSEILASALLLRWNEH